MGRNVLVEGERRVDHERSTDDSGAYDRAETSFRGWIRDEPGARFPPAADRYHLYVARNCPWAHGAALVRRLVGLTDAISMDVVSWPHITDDGYYQGEISPVGSGLDYDAPHDRDRLPTAD